MNFLRTISRYLIAVVFIFSGFVKAVDPLGSTYKFIDYFNAFGLGFFEPLAFPLAIILSSIELVLGINMLLAYRIKLFSWLLLIFMSFFTVLTLILALTNPVQDCGCFGDALVITNWQTFWKNVVLMFFTIVVFYFRNDFRQIKPAGFEWFVTTVFFIGSVFIPVYSYRNLPIIDFRPYKTGTYIPDGMLIPEGAPAAEFETVLHYKNKETGKEETFTLDNFPQDTLKWEFIDAVTNQLSEGYEPPIHDFNFIDREGSDITDDLLNNEGYSFILVSYDILKAKPKALHEANKFYRYSKLFDDVNFYAVSSSLHEDLDSLKKLAKLDYDFYQADEITLKTIIRANPGLVLMKNGTIRAKWHFNHFSGQELFDSISVILRNFPFCPGCELRNFWPEEEGTGNQVLQTSLFYRNLTDGEIYEFSMDNFPTDESNWVFENSVTTEQEIKKNKNKHIVIESQNGENLSEKILFSPYYSLIYFIKDPRSLSSEELNSMNLFAGLAMENLGDIVDVYAVSPLNAEESRQFSRENIFPFDFLSADQEFINSLTDESVLAVLLKDGKVFYSYEGRELPEPSELSSFSTPSLRSPEVLIEPILLNEMQKRINTGLILTLLMGLVLAALLTRFYRNYRD